MQELIQHLEQKYNENELATFNLEKLEAAKEVVLSLLSVDEYENKQNISLHIENIEVRTEGVLQIAENIDNRYSAHPLVEKEIKDCLSRIYKSINSRLKTEIKNLLHHFDFENQKEIFDEYWDEVTNCAAIIIHGKKNSGQELLLDHFIKINRLFSINKVTLQASRMRNIYLFEHLIQSLFKELCREDFKKYKNEELPNLLIQTLLEKTKKSDVIIHLKDWLKHLKSNSNQQNQNGIEQFHTLFWKPLLRFFEEYQPKYKIIICFVENQSWDNSLNHFALSPVDSHTLNQPLMLPTIEEICGSFIHQWIRFQVKASDYKPYFKSFYKLFRNEEECHAMIEEFELESHKDFHEFIYQEFEAQCVLRFQH